MLLRIGSKLGAGSTTPGPARVLLRELANSGRRPAAVGGVLALVGVRLWLVNGLAISAIGPSPHDDHLFLNLAASLISGNWLGPYNQLTLAKGPFYPMWIAASFGLGVPLLFSVHLLYVIACALFARALAPALPTRSVQLVLFALLLFCPASFADGPMSGVLRESVYSSLSLIAIGSAFALALRIDRPLRSNLAWILTFGTSLAAFWLCREERIWLVPALLVGMASALVPRPRAWRSLLRAAAAALMVFAVLVGAVVVKNGWHYGAYVITELTEGAFPRAYGALAWVQHAMPRTRVPLPSEARRRTYWVSPRFAELAPFLEGELGRQWSEHGCAAYAICDDLAAGWMLWALRDAAFLAGHYVDGREADRFWSLVASEVKKACGDGRLPCRRGWSNYLPPLRREHLRPLVEAWVGGARFLLSYDQIRPHPSPSVGPEELLIDFRDLTRSSLAPVELTSSPLIRQHKLAARQEGFLQWLVSAYGRLMSPLASVALIAVAVAGAFAVYRRRMTPLLLLVGALLVAVATRLAILSLLEVTSFGGMTVRYLSPLYPMTVAFVVLAFAALGELNLARKAGKSTVRATGTPGIDKHDPTTDSR